MTLISKEWVKFMSEERIIITKEELEANPDEIAEMCDRIQQPIFIENDKKIELVLMSIKCYKKMEFDLNIPIPDFD